MSRRPFDAFVDRVRRTLDRYAMLPAGEAVLVAVSGGPDSVALLAVLTELARRHRVTVRAAHFNHGLRGNDSLLDQVHAEAVARQLGVPIVVGRATPSVEAADLEARARRERYAFLLRVAADEGCSRIATGHTRDDQAETVLMRLLRGAGTDGLTGIAPVREDEVVRPLIECSRREVLAFLQARGLEYREDRSNREPRFLRNRVRHEVLPLLEQLNPQVREHLAATAAAFAEERVFLEHLATGALAEVEHPGGDLAVPRLAQLPEALQMRVLRAWLRLHRGDILRLTQDHWRAVAGLVRGQRPNATVCLPGRGEVVREYDRLRFVPDPAELVADETEHLLEPGSAVQLCVGWQIGAHFIGPEAAVLPSDLSTCLADAAHVALPLVVRLPRPGDRIRCLGLDGHRKLQDVFVDRKVARSARRALPLIEAGGEILWVPGVVRSRQALVSPRTRRYLCLTASKTGIAGPKPMC